MVGMFSYGCVCIHKLDENFGQGMVQTSKYSSDTFP